MLNQLLKPRKATQSPIKLSTGEPQKKDYAALLQQKLDVLIQEREQESQKLLFGIGSFALSKALFGGMSGASGEDKKKGETAMIQQRLKNKRKTLSKKTKFDKIIENQQQNQEKKKSDPLKKLGQQDLGNDQRMCKSMRKLGKCADGDKCTYAHSIEDIKYYRPQIWKNVIKSLGKKKHNDSDTEQSDISDDSPQQDKGEEHRLSIKNGIRLNGRSELMEACRTNNWNGVATLLEAGAKANQKDFFTRDAIFYCVKYKNFESLLEMIKGAIFHLDSAVTYANTYGNILHIAAQYANQKFLSKLLSIELYDTNLIDKLERSPIFYSVIRDDVESVKAIGKDSYLNFDDVYGKSLIDYARENHNEQILCFLVDQGANLGNNFSKGILLLFDCIYQGYFQLFQSLMKKGVPVTSLHPKTKDNVLLLSYSLGNKEIFNFLMNSSDQTLFAMTDASGQGIITKAVLKSDIGTLRKLLKKEGIQVDQQDQDNKTPLIYGCEINSYEIAHLLLQSYNCNLNIIDKHGQNAPMFAAMNDNLKILEELLNLKFNIMWQDSLGNHLYDHAKSDEARTLILDYIRNMPEFSQKDKLTITQQLTAKYSNTRPGSMSYHSQSINHQKLQAQLRMKQAKINQIHQDIDQEYKEQLQREGLITYVDPKDKKLIHEKFIQSKIAMVQLTKQAMHKAKENFKWKDKLVENYFIKEEEKIRRQLQNPTPIVKKVKLKPESIAKQLMTERRRMETANTVQNPPDPAPLSGLPMKEAERRGSEAAISHPLQSLTETPVSHFFSKIRNLKQQNDKDLKSIMRSLNRRESFLNSRAKPENQTSSGFFSQRKSSVSSKNIIQQIREGTIGDLSKHLHFSHDSREKGILEKILRPNHYQMTQRGTTSTYDDCFQEINTEDDQKKGIFGEQEQEIFRDKQYSIKEISKYFQTDVKFYTPRQQY